MNMKKRSNAEKFRATAIFNREVGLPEQPNFNGDWRYEILWRELGEGFNWQEIAEHYRISVKTIKYYAANAWKHVWKVVKP